MEKRRNTVVAQSGNYESLLRSLTNLCRKHVLPSETPYVVPEPYIPYIPASWNGILVTVEAQNLSTTNAGYRNWLLGLKTNDRIRRLYLREEIAVTPWSDGTLPLAVRAAWNAEPAQTAIGNAIPWSQIDGQEKNLNPALHAIECARSFWKETLPKLKPKILLVCGKKGRHVFEGIVEAAVPDAKVYYVAIPSPRFLGQTSWLFSESDLLRRYPEVAKAVKRCPEYVSLYRKNKIFYATHVVSVTSRKEVVTLR